MKVVITGGMGFIGVNLVRHVIEHSDWSVINVDKLTYAANPRSIADLAQTPRYQFEQADICDPSAMNEIFQDHRPDAVMHLAAESHVDRSIDGPTAFIETNITGTYVLLESALKFWLGDGKRDSAFRFLHVSTDEVFGSLEDNRRANEQTRYQPNSPYSASKAASDHLARAWHRTSALPVIISNCSNNYGPYQFPEKLIPLTILNAIAGKGIPVYGNGENVRDWLFVEDHVTALTTILEKGRVGECYNIGANSEMTNIDLVRKICAVLDDKLPDSPYRPHDQLIEFVADRPGHDLRYAMNPSKIMGELGWKPSVEFDIGLNRTVAWYLDHREWWEPLVQDRYGGDRQGMGVGRL